MPRAAARFDITATDKTKQAFATVNSKLGKLKGNALAVGSAFGIMGGIGVAAMAGAARKAIDFGSAITDMAIATGTGVEELQILQLAAREAGASNDQLASLMTRFTKSITDAENGLSTANRAFEKLGLNLDVLKNETMSRRLELLGLAIIRAEDQTMALGETMNLVGRSSPKLLEALQRLGTEGYDVLAEKAKKSGQIMEESTAQSLDAAADSIGNFKTWLTIQTGNILAPLFGKMPALGLSSGEKRELEKQRQAELRQKQIDDSVARQVVDLKLDDFFSFEDILPTKLAFDRLNDSLFSEEKSLVDAFEKTVSDPVDQGPQTMSFANFLAKAQNDVGTKAAQQRDEMISILRETNEKIGEPAPIFG